MPIRRRLPGVLATVAAPFIFYLIVRAALPAMSGAAAIAASSLPPRDFIPVLRRIAQLAPHPRFVVTPDMVELSRSAAVASPLAYEPFVIAAKSEMQAKRIDEAIPILEEARRRRPSHLSTRMLLMAAYGQAGRYRDTLSEMDVVLRLSSDARQLILPELTKLLGLSDGRRALAEVLAREPAWREHFLQLAGDRKLNPDHAQSLFNQVKAIKGTGNVDLERALFLKSLVGAGQFERARSTWLQSLPASARSSQMLVSDGAFRGSTGTAPFSWSLYDVDVGRAEFARADGGSYLDVSYFGGRSLVLAEQTLALGPGRYRLGVLAKSDSGIRSGQLYWRISCLPGASELATLQIPGLASAFRRIRAEFTVPQDNCHGQKLMLVAEPGDVASVANVHFARLEVTK